MTEVYHCDNSGNRTPGHPDMGDPIEETGQVVVAGSKDTDATITVERGARYSITCLGAHRFGIATTAVAANNIWACGDGHTIVIRIPVGYALLHYQTPADTRQFIIRKLA